MIASDSYNFHPSSHTPSEHTHTTTHPHYLSSNLFSLLSVRLNDTCRREWMCLDHRSSSRILKVAPVPSKNLRWIIYWRKFPFWNMRFPGRERNKDNGWFGVVLLQWHSSTRPFHCWPLFSARIQSEIEGNRPFWSLAGGEAGGEAYSVVLDNDFQIKVDEDDNMNSHWNMMFSGA